MADIKNDVLRLAEQYTDLGREINDTIWAYAEAGMKEHRSGAYYANVFEEKGFKVSHGVAGIPSAVVAEWGEGKPIVGFLAEYDALPGLSQKACINSHDPYDPDPAAYGHGCGHNSLGAGAAVAALIYRDYLKENNLPGTVRFYGCPGEEYGSGKVFMARDGLFDDLDGAFTWHPGDTNQIMGSGSLANISAFFTFHGKTAHAAGSPHLGRSALDACELMNVGCNYLREHMLPDARLHYAYNDAGGKAPNVVQDFAKVHYFVRAPKVDQMLELYERVCDVARGAALMTGTKVEIEIHEALCDYVPNKVLGKLVHQAMVDIGAPKYDEADWKMAEDFYKTYSESEIENVYSSLEAVGVDPECLPRGKALCDVIIPFFHVSNAAMGGSTDVGDTSRCTPTAQFNIATKAIGTPGHSWQVTAFSGSPIAHKGVMVAAEVMALAALRAAADPEIYKAARDEYNKSTGGKYLCPIPDYIKPTLDY